MGADPAGRDDCVHLTDRSTFKIISGGVNICPQEYENLLITHPKVLDAAVFGVPNEDLDRLPIAGMPPYSARVTIAAQWLACTYPCRRFADILTDANARLGADVVRYSFIAVDLHHLLLAGLPAHCVKTSAASKLDGPSTLGEATIVDPGPS